MRGKVSLIILLAQVTGITPAYAGKSKCLLYAINGGVDHPRVCGEK